MALDVQCLDHAIEDAHRLGLSTDGWADLVDETHQVILDRNLAAAIPLYPDRFIPDNEDLKPLRTEVFPGQILELRL